MFSDSLVLPWLERLRDEVSGIEAIDVHTHIGSNDPDGYRCSLEDLLAVLERADARGVVFPMHEPGGYPAANDMVLAAARESEGRLAAFCRLDPAADPLAEAERCLDAGAAGIKLHPRAENFTLDHPALDSVFALLHERRRPLIVHAGRGIPALGRHAVEHCERYPGARLILAHAGICDLSWVWRECEGLPNLFFDTAWWSPADLLALFCLVPPGQILFGSDAPYAPTAFALTMTLRYALQVGLSPDQVRSVAGGQAERLLRGEDPADLGSAPGTGGLSDDPLLDRVFGMLMTAVGQMFVAGGAEEVLALAALACEVGDDAPQAPTCSSILALLEERRRLVEAGESDGRPTPMTPWIHLVVVAAGLAKTPAVPLPPDPVAVDVGERSLHG